MVLCGVLWLFLRNKTRNFSDFIVLNQNGTLIYLGYLIFSSGADAQHRFGHEGICYRKVIAWRAALATSVINEML